MTELHYTFPGGKHNADVTSLTLVNNTAKTINTTVPTGKRWLLLNIKATNPDNVSRTVTVILWKEAALTSCIKALTNNITLATGVALNVPVPWEDADDATKGTDLNTVPSNQYPMMLEAGWTINIVWAAGGASAGATDADGLVIEYLEVDV